MGLLHWGTLVALFDGERPVIGVIHQPFLGETFSGDGHTAHYRRNDDSRALCTRPCPRLQDALAGTTAPELFKSAEETAAFQRIRATVRTVRYGTDCYLYAMLAMGQADLVIESGLKALRRASADSGSGGRRRRHHRLERRQPRNGRPGAGNWGSRAARARPPGTAALTRRLEDFGSGAEWVLEDAAAGVTDFLGA